MNFESLMSELKAEYIAELPLKIAAIEDHVKAGDTLALREDFHKLKGTGKTYGIPEVTEVAEVMEKICINQPQTALQVVMTAIHLLRQIHASRVNSQPLDVSANPHFSHLQSLTSA